MEKWPVREVKGGKIEEGEGRCVCKECDLYKVPYPTWFWGEAWRFGRYESMVRWHL